MSKATPQDKQGLKIIGAVIKHKGLKRFKKRHENVTNDDGLMNLNKMT